VFDAAGGFWFTDPQAAFPGQQGAGTVNYARTDGKEIRVVCGLAGDNGIALSPDGRTLYVARTQAAEVVAFDVVAPGRVSVDDAGRPRSRVLGRLTASGFGFDSLAVDVGGNLIIGTLNFGAPGDGALTVMASDGRIVQRIELPEKFVTSVGFGGPDRRTAFVTLTQTGRLVALDWPRPGLRLAGT
jgi:gluconolactonase